MAKGKYKTSKTGRAHGQRGLQSSWGITAGDLKIIGEIEDHSDEILEGINTAIVRALYRIGLECEGYAKLLCHVVTGRLRNSITFDLDGDAVYVGTNVEYAAFEEEGTSKRKPHPFLRPAAENHMDEWKQILQDELENG